MYKKPLRWIALSLAFILSASVLSGCSRKAQTNASSAASGEKFSFSITAPLYTAVDMNNEYWQNLEKMTNTHMEIQWIPSGDYLTKQNLMLASGNLTDVYAATDPTDVTLNKAISQGIFWDLTKMIGDFSKYPNLKKNISAGAWKYLETNGKIYQIPRGRAQLNMAYLIREDWLTKLNLPMPTTIDEFESDLQAMVKNFGTPQKPVQGLQFVEDLSAAFGAWNPTKESNGGIVPYRLSPTYVDFISWYRRLYSEGLISKEFTAIQDTQYEEMFDTGLLAAYYKNTWHDYTEEQAIQKTDKDGKVGVIPDMKGSKGYFGVLDPGFNGSLLISKKVSEDKAEKILQYYDKIASDEVSFFVNWGTKDVDYTMQEGVPVLTETGAKNVNNSVDQPFTFKCAEFFKVDAPTAPPSYNKAIENIMKDNYKHGMVNPWGVIQSSTYTKTWPQYNDEYTAMRTKAITGQISMDEFTTYVNSLKNKPEFLQAAKEYEESYKADFGK